MPRIRRSYFNWKFFVFVFVLLFLFSRFFSSSSHSEGFFAPLHLNIQKYFRKLGNSVSDLWRNYFDLRNVREENEKLKLKLEELEKTNILLLTQKNTVESRPTSQLSSQFYPIISANILAYDPLPSEKKVWINKGSKQGVQNTSAVVLANSAVVGLIVEVRPEQSLLQLLVDPKSVIHGEVVGGGARGIVEGKKISLGFNRETWITQMEYLENTNLIKEGDVVYSSGLDKIFPKGLMIGKVVKVGKDEKGLFLSADILPAVDYTQLNDLFVLPPMTHQ